MEILASIVGNIVPSVGEYWNYHKEADQHVKNLKRKWELLEGRKDDIKKILDSELRQGKKPKQEVKLWLQNVETIKGDIDIGQEPARWMFLSRMRKGEYAFKKTKEVEELYLAGDFTDGFVLDLPERIGKMMPPSTLVGESTAQRTKKEILACMLDNNVGKIGVYGMGGIGKTTVMKEVNNFLLNESNKFESVIWVTVSKEFDLIKLQNDIACRLKLELPEFEDEIIRAAELYTALKDRRYALILDDLWETFALEKVGIPEPTSTNGCKIVLTTRDLDVCRGMSYKNIKMELLSKEEAQELFLYKMEYDVFNTPYLKAIAEDVLQTCARLPLAIVTIAGSFKRLVHDYEWRDALEQLRTSLKGFDNIEKQVHEVLKFSYEGLKEEKLKQCLLHCALYPEDFKIDKKELIEDLIDERIIERMKSRQAEYDRGYSMLNKLENASLLEGGIGIMKFDRKEFVKMHDLVRDMVLLVASPEFMVGHLGLKDFSDEGKWRENLVKASLMYNKISRIPSNVSPMCPNLSTLLLHHNSSLGDVPDSLFEHLHGLKVLNLSYIGIESLPNSVFSLKNLTTLRLRRCINLKHVSSLAKLTTLRKLDLSVIPITEVPGLEMLVNLTYLNLDAWNLKIMPLGILPKLSHLQYLRFSCKVTVKGEEIERLKKLENVWVRFDDLYEFCSFIRSLEKRRLACYQIQVGESEEDRHRDIQDVGKGVILQKCNLGRGGESLVLPEDVQYLEIVECHDLTSLCDVPSLKYVRELKKIILRNCKGIEHVLSSSSVTDSLQTLEILELWGLDNLRGLFRKERTASARVPPNTFSRLQTIALDRCPNIKKLLPPGLLLHLRNLDEIYVYACGVEEIIGEASDEFEEEEEKEEEGMDTTKITLPNLRLLELWELPGLKTICSSSKVIVCDSLETIQMYKCPKVKRLPLSLPLLNGQLSPPPSLKEIEADKEWWESLDCQDTKNVLQPFFRLRQF
ncbi:disease resistance protein At4g27190-like [Castanea sativa]|uniref:disease resistance protein At4g27190-like n=1 Tax=Castanea sativa TaxID=21020 RepID=UPI003F6520D7